MKFSNGEYVMYGAAGICRIDGEEKRSFDGIHSENYYKLIPYDSESSTYYIPINTLEQKVRKLLNKDEILSIIDQIPSIEPIWNNNNNERRELFSDLLKSDDYSKVFCLIKSLYEQRRKRGSAGKKLAMTDEKTMKTAENMVYQEFAYVLGIKPDDVTDFISERIENVI